MSETMRDTTIEFAENCARSLFEAAKRYHSDSLTSIMLRAGGEGFKQIAFDAKQRAAEARIAELEAKLAERDTAPTSKDVT